MFFMRQHVNRAPFGCDFLQLGVVVAPHALKLPEEAITRRGEYWCEVTVSVPHAVPSDWVKNGDEKLRWGGGRGWGAVSSYLPG